MRIAVLSGKGGTGKTFISTNLAYAKGSSVYIDCDVEEPNGRLFLKPRINLTEKVNVMVPVVDAEKCTGCRRCVDFCKFNALAYIKDKLLIFPDLCHSCKGCVMVCSNKALMETNKHIGYIEYGISKNVKVLTGILNTGEATGVPIIHKMLSNKSQDLTVIVDCPPGSSCTVMESIKDADFCLLVAEPTVFGIHNLNMVYKLVKLFNKPHAIIVNKDMGDKNIIQKFCKNNDIKVIANIPYDAEIGFANSKGLLASEEDNRYLNLFKGILDMIEMEVQHEATCNIER